MGRHTPFQSSSGMKFRDVAGDSRAAVMFACASSVSRQDFCEVRWDMITNIVVIKTCEHFISKLRTSPQKDASWSVAEGALTHRPRRSGPTILCSICFYEASKTVFMPFSFDYCGTISQTSLFVGFGNMSHTSCGDFFASLVFGVCFACVFLWCFMIYVPARIKWILSIWFFLALWCFNVHFFLASDRHHHRQA